MDITVERIVFDTTNSKAASKQIYCLCTAVAAMAAFCSLFGLSGSMLFVVTFYATMHQNHFLFSSRLRRMIFCVNITFPFINLYTHTMHKLVFHSEHLLSPHLVHFVCHYRSLDPVSSSPSIVSMETDILSEEKFNLLSASYAHSKFFVMLALWFLSISQETNQSTN